MNRLKIAMLLPVYAVAAIVISIFARYSLPDAEAFLFPVITEVRNTDVERTADKICWNYHFHKARQAETRFMSWTMIAGRRRGFVSPYNARTGEPLTTDTMLPKGATRDSPLCVDVPEPFRTTANLKIEGQITYLPWHGLWMLDSDIPIFPPDPS